MLGVFHKKEFTGNRFFSIGAGGDINFEIITGGGSQSMALPITAGYGAFVRAGFAF